MSNSYSDRNQSLFAPCIACSGMFLCNFDPYSIYSDDSSNLGEHVREKHQQTTTAIFNPMPLKVQQGVADAVPVETQQSFLDEYHKAKKYKLFDRPQFDDYAKAIFEELIPNLVRQQHDLFLFPLRGCRQPGILAKVIANLPDQKLAVFNYTYSTRDTQQSLIEDELCNQLREKLPEQGIVSFGVIDTAKGGYGSRHLAQMLSTLHSTHFGNQSWSVQFHLIHARNSSPTLSHEIPRFASDKLIFLWPIFYEVDSLLIEDWSEGIGLAVEESGSQFELKRCVEPGRILYRDADSVQLIESDSLCDTMTSLTVDAVNRVMLNDSTIEYVKDVWNHDLAIEGKEDEA